MSVPTYGLTPLMRKRWIEIINCLAHGLTMREAAGVIGLSESIIKQYSVAMRNHFGAATTLEAVLIASREWNLNLYEMVRKNETADSVIDPRDRPRARPLTDSAK